MPIPALLAYPPTALRSVSAGLVVGNPIGSSGTRAKALTSAELKAIVEASGISYLPSSGGTLTGPITGTSDTLIQRRGVNAQCSLINKTYTSDSSQEALMLDAGKQISGKLGLYSYRGSAGGSNYPIQIGMLAANGTTFAGLVIDTSGGVTSPTIYVGDAFNYFTSPASQQCRLTPFHGFRIDKYSTSAQPTITLGNRAANTSDYLACSILDSNGVPASTSLRINYLSKLLLVASTTSTAPICIPDGVAPTTPADGDIWCVGDVLYRRISGVTKSLTFI